MISHAVQARTRRRKDNFAHHEVDEHHHAAQWRERVMHGVDRAATASGGDGGEQRGLGYAEAHLLALHVAGSAVALPV